MCVKAQMGHDFVFCPETNPFDLRRCVSHGVRGAGALAERGQARAGPGEQVGEGARPSAPARLHVCSWARAREKPVSFFCLRVPSLSASPNRCWDWWFGDLSPQFPVPFEAKWEGTPVTSKPSIQLRLSNHFEVACDMTSGLSLERERESEREREGERTFKRVDSKERYTEPPATIRTPGQTHAGIRNQFVGQNPSERRWEDRDRSFCPLCQLCQKFPSQPPAPNHQKDRCGYPV